MLSTSQRFSDEFGGVAGNWAAELSASPNKGPLGAKPGRNPYCLGDEHLPSACDYFFHIISLTTQHCHWYTQAMPPGAPIPSPHSWAKAELYKPDRREFEGRTYTKVGQLNEQTSRNGDVVWAHIRLNANAAYTASLIDDDGSEIKATRVYTSNELDPTRARPWDVLTPIVTLDLLPVNSKEAAGAFFRVMYIVQEEADVRSVKLADILRSVIDYDRPYPRLRRDYVLKPRMRKRRRLSDESSIDVCRQ